MNTIGWIIAAVIVLAAGGLIVAFYQKRRTDRLRSHFGREYDYAVSELGDRRRAEAALEARKKRVERLDLHPLSTDDAKRFADRFRKIELHFIDNPKAAVTEANDLVKEVLQARGYPIGDFEQRVADISVHHASVVDNYRIARDFAVRNQRGMANTEELRKAVVCYRALMEELLGIPEIHHTAA